MSPTLNIADQLIRISNVFIPGAAIKTKEYFIGRIQILAQCSSILDRPGTHIVIYGNRGVGKTSLATILLSFFSDMSKNVFITTCDSVDTYESLWRKLFKDVVIQKETEKEEWNDGDEDGTRIELDLPLPQESYKNFGVVEVMDVLRAIGGYPVIILDEFDRLSPSFNRRLFADTIKAISDNLLSVTLIVVGVGKDISSLIGEHSSIERNLVQIKLPEMSNSELLEIITKGLDVLGMKMDEKMQKEIVKFSCGYPHFTHLLSLYACRCAVLRSCLKVDFYPDFDLSVSLAIQESFESLRKGYHDATTTNIESLYEEVSWAAALAETDENYSFQDKDLLVPLGKILGKAVKYQ